MYQISYYAFTIIIIVFEYSIVSAYFSGHNLLVFPIVPLYKWTTVCLTNPLLNHADAYCLKSSIDNKYWNEYFLFECNGLIIFF